MNVLVGWPKSIRGLEEGTFCHLDGAILPGTEPSQIILIPRVKSIVHLCHSSWMPSTINNVMSVHSRGQVIQRRLRCKIGTDELELILKVLHREWDPLVGFCGDCECQVLMIVLHAGIGICGV